MGVDSAVVCLSVVLPTPMYVIWRCEPPLYNHVSSPTLKSRDDKQETGICGLPDCSLASLFIVSTQLRFCVVLGVTAPSSGVHLVADEAAVVRAACGVILYTRPSHTP